MERYNVGLYRMIKQATKKRKNGSVVYPIKLRVTINRQTRYYGLDCYLTKDEFETAKAGKAKKELRKTYLQLTTETKKALDILENLEFPNFHDFKRLYVGNEETLAGDEGNVVKYYNSYIKECKQDNRLGTASSYECSMKSLDKEMSIQKLNFKDITVKWLKDYERKMKAGGKTRSTIGIYLRPLRHLYNKAISDGVVPEKYYPFKRKNESKSTKYEIPTSERNKRPLDISEIRAIKEYSGNSTVYRDFFLLSFYLSGLNFMDLLTIQWKDIEGDILTIERKKTGTRIKLAIGKSARIIIDKYASGGRYVFSVISENDAPDVIRQKVQYFTRNTNQALEKIAKELGINKKISTVYARHSAASIALEKNVNIATISEALGHTNLTTTSNYISSLGIENKKELSNSLEV